MNAAFVSNHAETPCILNNAVIIVLCSYAVCAKTCTRAVANTRGTVRDVQRRRRRGKLVPIKR